MIERLYAKNYRAFEEFDIDLSKINLFFGPNNSGKSSILSVINLLSQTLISSDITVPLLLRGVKEDLGTYQDLVFNHDVKNDIIIGIQSDHHAVYNSPYTYESQKERKSVKLRGSIELRFSYRPRRHEIILKNVELKIDDSIKLSIKKAESYNSSNYYLTEMKQADRDLVNKKIKVDDMHHFLPSFVGLPYLNSSSFNFVFFETLTALRRFNSKFRDELKSVEFIGPFREPPHRTYLFSGESPESVGVTGERAVDIVTMDHLKQRGKEKKDMVNRISKWYRSCGISEKLRIRLLSDRHYEIVLSHINSKSEESLADVGFGCSQVLPVLVAGYNLEKGDILVVQEPEIHLHPRAQAELGSFFYELSKKGIQTIIETHSEHLMLRIQAHIADKNSKLAPEDVCVYYVYVEDGVRKIKKIELGEDGFFKDQWPDGFFPERYLEAKKIAKGSMLMGD